MKTHWILTIVLSLVGVTAAEMGPPIGHDKKVIKTGQDCPTPAYLLANIAEMERLPLDGVAIALERPGAEPVNDRRLVFQWWQPVRIEEQVHTDTVATLNQVAFRRFTDNFLWISTQSRGVPAPSWTDDEAFAAIRDNMVLAARIAKDAGLRGIMLDVEQYGGMHWSRWMMRFAYPYAHSQEQAMLQRKTIDRIVPWEEHADAARRRGREIVASMCAIYPEITILVLPGLHHVARERIGRGNHWLEQPLTGLPSSDYALLAAFGDGMLEGMSDQATLIDGYEDSYAFTLNKRFVSGRQEIADAACVSEVPDLYRRRMGTGFGLMLDNRYNVRGGWHTDDFYANHFTPTDWGNALYFGMLNSDRYVWVWNEMNGAVCFPNARGTSQPSDIPDQYYTVMREARRPRPLQTSRDNARAQEFSVPSSDPGYDEQETYGPLAAEFEFITDLPEAWRFFADDESLGIGEYTVVDLDESDWTTISTHDFLQRQGHRFRGIAWFRCWFDLPHELKGRQVHLLFGGVSTNHFYVNGNWLHREQKDGVWIVDFTDVARFGERNLVALGVVTQGDAGGLYKPVKLAVEK